MLADAQGDHGVEGPAYADIRQVTLADDGQRVRVTVVLGAGLRVQLRDTETMGIGVDFYRRSGQRESDVQLFADGGRDGWFAYLQRGSRFVRYPGTFAIGADRVVFTLPWSALGVARSGTFSAFADWTERRAPVNAASSDRAPTLGSTSYAR